MAAIRRHPALTAAVAGLLAVLALVLILWPHPQAQAQAGEPFLPVSAVDAANVLALRSGAGFDDDVLACINPTAQQLDTALPALRNWYDTHGPDALAAQRAVADQQARIRRIESAIANGQDQSAALLAAQQQLTQLQAAYETALADLRTATAATLSTSQQTLLDQMRVRPTTPMPFRILALTVEQQNALARVNTDYQQRLALARDPQTRAALATLYTQQLADTLGPNNLQLLAALAEYRGPAAERVTSALQTVFPMAPEG
jgi:hypothetical protein